MLPKPIETGFTAVGKLSGKALNAVLPPICLGCKTQVPAQGTVCSACWEGIHFIAAPFCECCGLPFAFAVDAGSLCAGCLDDTPHFEFARSVMVYRDTGSALVKKLKFQDGTHLAPYLAKWMERAAPALVRDADVIVPVPLHPRRLFMRRYNQAALLAGALAKAAKKPMLVDALFCTRHEVHQVQLNKKERRSNVKGLYGVAEKALQALEGRHVLLVDDVMTTGATADECAGVLVAHGAQKVSVITLARTVLQ